LQEDVMDSQIVSGAGLMMVVLYPDIDAPPRPTHRLTIMARLRKLRSLLWASSEAEAMSSNSR
jgi:hypothetical protein